MCVKIIEAIIVLCIISDVSTDIYMICKRIIYVSITAITLVSIAYRHHVANLYLSIFGSKSSKSDTQIPAAYISQKMKSHNNLIIL